MSKELRWSFSGFIGGVVVCYALMVAFHQPQQTTRSAKLTQMLMSSSVPGSRITIHLDNPQLSKLRPVSSNYRSPLRPSPELRHVPPGTLPERYSTDLIDGRDQSLK